MVVIQLMYKCTETEEYIQNRIIYKSVSAPRRTDLVFQLFIDKDRHKGVSSLSKPIGLVTKFRIYFMYAVCLDVMKKTFKLLNTWMCGNLKIRLPGRSVNLVSERLIHCRKFIPIV